MILTELEARGKWCHQTLIAAPSSPSGSDFMPCACHGSACVAWRWYDDGSDEQPRRGYCGLAGKPGAAG
jgi:hypothetical protein